MEKVTNATLICPHDKFKYPMLFVSEFLKFDEDAYEMYIQYVNIRSTTCTRWISLKLNGV